MSAVYHDFAGQNTGNLNRVASESEVNAQSDQEKMNELQAQQGPQMQGVTVGGGAMGQAATSGAAQGQAAPNINAAQVAGTQLDTGNYNQDRSAQQALAGSLQGTINGTGGPSVAQLQQNQAFGQLAAQQAGQAAAAGRGGNQALAARTAMQNMGQLGSQQAAQSALLRANEVATAQGQLGGLTSNMAGQDVNVAGQNAGLTQNAQGTNAGLQQSTNMANQGNAQAMNLANLANRQATISQNTANQQQTGMANQANTQQVNLANQAALQQAAANNQASQTTANQQFITQQANLGQLANQANAGAATGYNNELQGKVQSDAQVNSTLSGAAGAAAMMSDRRVKDDIKPLGSGAVSDMLDKIAPSTFRYKGSARPETGLMAQDLERSSIGRGLVRETPQGVKAVDVGRTAMTSMAALADMHARLKRVEATQAAPPARQARGSK